MFTCNICGKQFNRNSDYIRHSHRKYPCVSKNIDIPDPNKQNIINDKKINETTIKENIKQYKCLLCDKLYTTRSGLNYHKKKHENYEEQTKNIIEKTKEEPEECIYILTKIKSNNETISDNKTKQNKNIYDKYVIIVGDDKTILAALDENNNIIPIEVDE